MNHGRRSFLTQATAGVLAVTSTSPAESRPPLQRAVSDVAGWRAEFPVLGETINGKPLIYFDSAATTQRPRAVIEAIVDFYRYDNANPSAALHSLARRAHARYQEARRTLARFLNAPDPEEIVWVRGTTEAINLVAASWGSANLREGDEILLTVAEHYSNLLPWRAAARGRGARIRTLDVDERGALRLDQLDRLLSSNTKLVAVTHVSNVLGLVNPVQEICARARKVGARILIDGAQSAPHVPIDVQALGCDFFAFSSHKLLGPMGVGVLWAKRPLLDQMPPYQTGSNMAHEVSEDAAEIEHAGPKFQAGTPNVSGPVGLARAVDFLEQVVGFEALAAHDHNLTERMLTCLGRIPGLRLIGPPSAAGRIPVFTFVIEGVPVPHIVKTLDEEGIAIRAGDMAALPLLKRYGVSAAARASLYLYNTLEEIDRFGEVLERLTRSPR